MQLRRIRAIVGMAAWWAIAWGLTGMLWGAAQLPLRPEDHIPLGPAVFWGFASFAAYGGCSGVVFGSLLAVAERRRAVEHLSAARVVGWGVLSALAIPLVAATAAGFGMPTGVQLAAIAILAFLGAGSATLTLALARRSPPVHGP
jgi:hypothetical protein